MSRTTSQRLVAVTAALLLTRWTAWPAADEPGRRLPPPACNLRLAAPVLDAYEAVALGQRPAWRADLGQ